ncbi:hypothetical protein F4604DRAFT_1961160 [Suillus subluteus]|nr:hypothetical protein F4604DRAFT_1961160 [Suillus subluteus]
MVWGTAIDAITCVPLYTNAPNQDPSPPFHYPAVALHCPTNLTNTFLMLAPTGAAAPIYCSLLIPTSTSCAPSTSCTSTTPALQGQHPATSHHPGTPTQTLPRPSMNLFPVACFNLPHLLVILGVSRGRL